jgi:hypothetical protein
MGYTMVRRKIVKYEYFSAGDRTVQCLRHISGTAGAWALKLGQRVVRGMSKRMRRRSGRSRWVVARTARAALPVR